MSPGPRPLEPAAGLDEEVAFWDARLRSPLCTEADRATFGAWRDGDPAKAAAFAHFQAHLEALRSARSAIPELRAYRDEALGHGLRRWRPAAAAAAAVLVGVSLVALWGWTRMPTLPATEAGPPASVFETAVGERSTVKLSDGSTAVLDTHTRLEVRYRTGERRIHLLQGQALFDVAKDPSRPFVVAVANQRVTAVGTQFAVRLDPQTVSVIMVEGKVRVGPLHTLPGAPADIAERRLTAGQRMVASADFSRVRIGPADVRSAIGWTDGRVVFENTPLSQAVAELRRYSPTPITVADDRTGDIRISGMAKTDEPLTFVRALPEYFPVVLRSDGRRLILSWAARGRRDP